MRKKIIIFNLVIMLFFSVSMAKTNDNNFSFDGQKFAVDILINFKEISSQVKENTVGTLGTADFRYVTEGFCMLKNKGLQTSNSMSDSYNIYPDVVENNGYNINALDKKIYKDANYIGIKIKNNQPKRAVLGIQGIFSDNYGYEKSFYIKEQGEAPIIYIENDKAYKFEQKIRTYITDEQAIDYNMEGKASISRFCFFVPDNFDGVILIPTSRIIEYNGENSIFSDDIVIKSIGFHSSEGSVIIESLFALNDRKEKFKNALSTYFNEELEKRITPFWKEKENNTAIMNEEIVTLIQREDEYYTTEDGTEGNLVYGRLLFIPTKIISVKDTTLNKEYKEGKDYVWQEGTNRIYLGSNSEIKIFSADLLNGIKNSKTGEMYPTWDGSRVIPLNEDFVERFINNIGKSYLYLRHSRLYDFHNSGVKIVSPIIYERQISVTYEYELERIEKQAVMHTGNEKNNTGNIEKISQKLANDEDVNVLVVGDSIAAGFDSSYTDYMRPYMPTMSTLIRDGLQQNTKGKVVLDNIAIAGHSVENSHELIKNKYENSNNGEYFSKYDLVILSIGMNSHDIEPSMYKEKILSMIKMMKSKNSNLEFLLVSCMSPNIGLEGFVGKIPYQGDMLLEIMKEQRQGIAVVDFYEMHRTYLYHKDYISTSSDNLRHPNDWLIRIYVQNILAKIV